jgi:protocatechuate 3,4-dioxygenase beta subunit
MMFREPFSRRHVLGLILGVTVLALPGSGTPVEAQTPLKQTPGQILGPFYPVAKPPTQSADLVNLPGRPGRAEGQILHVMGRVLTREGKPIEGARVEIWQANTYGRYTHPSDQNPARLDPNFEGYGVQVTDAEGRYHFRTIKPGAYPTGPNSMRPPHIHFEVTGRQHRLITQMYFAGEALNEADPFLQSAGAGKERLIVSLKPAGPDLGPEPDALVAVWDIVLAGD